MQKIRTLPMYRFNTGLVFFEKERKGHYSKKVKEATSYDEKHINTIFNLQEDVSACKNLVKAQCETINLQKSWSSKMH